MADEFIITQPVIKSAVFSVNPVGINNKTILTVEVEDKTIVLEPYFYYSNDIFSGEV